MDYHQELLRISIVAKMLGVSVTTIRRVIRDGTLPTVTIGGRTLVPLIAVRELIDSWRITVSGETVANSSPNTAPQTASDTAKKSATLPMKLLLGA